MARRLAAGLSSATSQYLPTDRGRSSILAMSLSLEDAGNQNGSVQIGSVQSGSVQIGSGRIGSGRIGSGNCHVAATRRMSGALHPAVGRAGYFDRELNDYPALENLLGAGSVRFQPRLPWQRVDTTVGWGTGCPAAESFARAAGTRLLRVHEGFLASRYSLVVDDLGMHFDPTRPSRLERWIAEGEQTNEQLGVARSCINRIRAARLTARPGAEIELGAGASSRVLVVLDDIEPASASASASAEEVVSEARSVNPDAEVVVLATGGRRPRYLSGVRVVADVSAASLLSQVARVYTVASHVGFEALYWGVPVTCFGMPWYAGWGLTDDRAAAPPLRRSAARTSCSIERLFCAAYMQYARYVNPETGRRCQLEEFLADLELQKQEERRNVGQTVGVGFSIWKRDFVPSFLRGSDSRVAFARDASEAAGLLEPTGRLLVWGRREDEALRDLATRKEVEIWRMEDGFLRSVGLGSDLYRPASLVIDRIGIYYDPQAPSELERILSSADFSAAELVRAKRLREKIVGAAVSKYNIGVQRPIGGSPTSTVLVIGQVEDDASVMLGTKDVRSNMELLRAVREARPSAYLLYKEHPDVVSGNRPGRVRDARAFCDELVSDVALPHCLKVSREVHTMTSLVGFEALLRGLEVHVYGLPFYAGWGLTHDRHAHPRRTRRLSLDELVAGTLIRYPRYVSPRSGRYTTPERIVDLLAAQSRQVQGRGNRLRKQIRKLRHLVEAVRNGD